MKRPAPQSLHSLVQQTSISILTGPLRLMLRPEVRPQTVKRIRSRIACFENRLLHLRKHKYIAIQLQAQATAPGEQIRAPG